MCPGTLSDEEILGMLLDLNLESYGRGVGYGTFKEAPQVQEEGEQLELGM